jgi:hypothetical protein
VKPERHLLDGRREQRPDGPRSAKGRPPAARTR